MTFEAPGAPALDYQPCRYGQSKLLFRGPASDISGTYFAILGGSETYGRFVQSPFTRLLQERLDCPVANLGCMNAGVDVFLNDPFLPDLCGKARGVVVQILGAQNMTNRFYAVHPRRNDRFLRASQAMKSMFREIDFAEYNFTRHMLSDLKVRAPERFLLIESELRDAWISRMRQLLGRLGRRTVLLWLGDYHVPGTADGLGPPPTLVDEEMVHSVAGMAAGVVRIEPSTPARLAGATGMTFGELEASAAAELPGPAIHREIADALEPVLRRLL